MGEGEVRGRKRKLETGSRRSEWKGGKVGEMIGRSWGRVGK